MLLLRRITQYKLLQRYMRVLCWALNDFGSLVHEKILQHISAPLNYGFLRD